MTEDLEVTPTRVTQRFSSFPTSYSSSAPSYSGTDFPLLSPLLSSNSNIDTSPTLNPMAINSPENQFAPKRWSLFHGYGATDDTKK